MDAQVERRVGAPGILHLNDRLAGYFPSPKSMKAKESRLGFLGDGQFEVEKSSRKALVQEGWNLD